MTASATARGNVRRQELDLTVTVALLMFVKPPTSAVRRQATPGAGVPCARRREYTECPGNE